MIKGKHEVRGQASAGMHSERSAEVKKFPDRKSGAGAVGSSQDPVVRLLNISRAGALLESDTRLFTGFHICLRLNTTDATFLLKGRILRSKTSTQDGSNIKYESAVAFEEDFVLLDQDLPRPQRDACSAEPIQPEMLRKQPVAGSPAALISPAVEYDRRNTIFTETSLTQRSGTDLRRILGLERKPVLQV
jgi:hypothetical protein